MPVYSLRRVAEISEEKIRRRSAPAEVVSSGLGLDWPERIRRYRLKAKDDEGRGAPD